MTFDAGISTLSTQNVALDSQADRLLKQTRSTSATGLPASNEDAKIKKAGSDFESILLGSWLQEAEKTFASVPGGDEEDDGGAGKDQFQGIAMQALAGSLTKSGGIGIAKMITLHLHSAAESERTRADAKLGIPQTSNASSEPPNTKVSGSPLK